MNNLKACLGCIAISESRGISLNVIEELFFYKEQGMDNQYRELLMKVKAYGANHG